MLSRCCLHFEVEFTGLLHKVFFLFILFVGFRLNSPYSLNLLFVLISKRHSKDDMYSQCLQNVAFMPHLWPLTRDVPGNPPDVTRFRPGFDAGRVEFMTSSVTETSPKTTITCRVQAPCFCVTVFSGETFFPRVLYSELGQLPGSINYF